MQLRTNSLQYFYTLIIGVVIIIATGGATNAFSQILTLFLTGGILLILPPKYLPGKWIVGIAAAFLFWILFTVIVPVPMGTVTSWLNETSPGLVQTHSISPQPHLSLEKSLYFLCALMWLFLVMSRPMSHRKRRQCYRLLTFLLFALSVVGLCGLVLNFQHPFTWGTHKFSYFPNHNQTGAVFALGAILAMGMILRSIKRKSWEVILFLLIFAVFVFAIVLGMSRSSVLILAAGCALSVLFTLEKKNYTFYLKLGVPFFVILAAIFILYGGKLIDEFLVLLGSGGIEEEFRLLIYLDTFKIIGSFGLLGVGMGSFRYIFPMFQNYAGTPQGIHHPESDFLWTLVELGVPGLLLMVVGIALLVLRLDPVDIVKTKGARLMGFVSLSMFLFASLIEVSGHRLGTVLLAIVVFGVSQPERAKLYRSKLFETLSRIVGFVFLAIGGVWLFHTINEQPFTKEDVHDYYGRTFADIIEGRDLNEVSSELDSWIKKYPLMPRLHELKGRLYLQGEPDLEAADRCFKRSQALAPSRWKNMSYHGVFVHQFDFDLALGYWFKAIEAAGPQHESEAFTLILRNISRDLYPKLRDLSYSNRKLQFQYLATIRGSKMEFSREFGLELAINPELNGFSSEQKQALFWHFTKQNGTTMLKRLLESHPVLGSENWTVKAQLEAGEKNFKEASRLAVMNLPKPEMIDLTRGRSLSSIRSEYLLDSDDQLKVVALVQKQEADGFYQDALISLQIALRKGIKNKYLEFELALIYFYLGQYEDSWKEFERIVEQSIEW